MYECSRGTEKQRLLGLNGDKGGAYEFWGTHSPKQAPSEYILRSIIKKKLKILHIPKICSNFAPAFGKMAEWSIASVLKTEVRKRTGGSNPSLSA